MYVAREKVLYCFLRGLHQQDLHLISRRKILEQCKASRHTDLSIISTGAEARERRGRHRHCASVTFHGSCTGIRQVNVVRVRSRSSISVHSCMLDV